jgi:hypothetical protein
MARIEERLRLLREGSTIDKILDQGSRSNSRMMMNRTADSGTFFVKTACESMIEFDVVVI